MLFAWLNVSFSWYHWQQTNRSWFDYQTRRGSESIWSEEPIEQTFFLRFSAAAARLLNNVKPFCRWEEENFFRFTALDVLSAVCGRKSRKWWVVLYNEETIFSFLFWVVRPWAKSNPLLICIDYPNLTLISFGVFSAVLLPLTARHHWVTAFCKRPWSRAGLFLSPSSFSSPFFFVYKTTAEFWISSIISPIKLWETTSSGASPASSTANCVRSSVSWRGSAYRTTITGVIILVIWILRITFYTRAIWLRKKAACTMAQRSVEFICCGADCVQCATSLPFGADNYLGKLYLLKLSNQGSKSSKVWGW